MTYTVHQVAQIGRISVRTLHYYDQIGLLTPRTTAPNGYRLYGPAELDKLQQILFFRELGFPLTEIKRIMIAAAFDGRTALADQKQMLELKRRRLTRMIRSIDRSMGEGRKVGESMNTDDMFGPFSDDQMEAYKREAKLRWGTTEAYRQSAERTKHWTREDYKKAAKEGVDITREIAGHMDEGPESPAVQAGIGKHYAYIARFYELPYAMYRNLGQMYVDDSRFTAYYENVRHGLAAFMRDAIARYCDVRENA
jgi:DNA-binding transcriptional MerR regulator